MCQAVGVDELTIPARFNGPPDSGNGGYSAGLVAAQLPEAADSVTQVTLRVPPPLDTPLRVRPATGDDGIAVYAGSRLIAQAGPASVDDRPVPPVSYPEAVAAATGYPGFVEHPFPTCYVCGPERLAGDGLRIFPGPVPDGRTAAPWLVPPESSAVTVWAALDCPGGWAIIGSGRPYVLGRMAARIHALPSAGTRCVVMGEVIGTEGRKAQVHTALYDRVDRGRAAPRLLAWARSTWIAI
jgi:hypothetical protein